MHEVTRIRIRRNGWEFELRTSKDWTEVLDICGKQFSGSTKDIGGPKLVEMRE